MSRWKKVSKAKLDAFVAAYPQALKKDFTSICEPPMLSYNDFSDGRVWPESMVAKVILHSRWDPKQKDDYFILSK